MKKEGEWRKIEEGEYKENRRSMTRTMRGRLRRRVRRREKCGKTVRDPKKKLERQ